MSTLLAEGDAPLKRALTSGRKSIRCQVWFMVSWMLLLRPNKSPQAVQPLHLFNPMDGLQQALLPPAPGWPLPSPGSARSAPSLRGASPTRRADEKQCGPSVAMGAFIVLDFQAVCKLSQLRGGHMMRVVLQQSENIEKYRINVKPAKPILQIIDTHTVQNAPIAWP